MTNKSAESKELVAIPDGQTPELVLKYDRPKIIGIDLEQVAIDGLRAIGFNVSTGSFGRPYRVKVSDNYLPVICNDDIPANISEQEIVIIDLHPDDFLDGPTGTKGVSDGTPDWWALCSSGIIDPRTRAMIMYNGDFQRIYGHGGIFIIFAVPRWEQSLVWANVGYAGFNVKYELPYDNWSFLDYFAPKDLRINSEFGEEIQVVDKDYPLMALLRKYLKGATFDCTFTIEASDKTFLPLATNKYGSAVAAIAAPPDAEGRLFILPDIKDKAGFLVEFVRDLLPAFAPKLFPQSKNSSWSERPEYEFPEIMALKSQIEQIRADAEEKVAALSQKMLV